MPTSSSDTNQLSLLSGSHTRAESCANEPKTDGSPDCTCGKATLDCSIHPSTPAAWIAFMQDSLVKTLALLESRQAYLREPDQGFTAKSCASLGWYDPSSCSWRTYQQSFLTDSEPYSETWPRWGMTQGGSAYAHPMSGRRITETDGFCWPTPRAANPGSRPNGKGGKILAEEVEIEEGLRQRGVKMFPTPTTNDAKNSTLPESQRFRDGMAGTLLRDGEIAGGQLNPSWVAWLMGFPIGWASLKATETPKSRCKPQPHGDCLEANK